MKLDRKKPFGDVQGDSEGRRYHQDGVYFGVDGERWIDPSAPATKDVAPMKKDGKAETVKTPAAADDQVNAQLKG